MENFSHYNYKAVQMHEDMRKILESSGIVRSFPKGSIIYCQGDPADCFYYLKKGKITVFMTSIDGLERTLSTAARGEILGEGAFFDKNPRVSSARTATNCELIRIDKDKLTELIKQYPKLAFELLEILAIRIRQLSNQLDSMTFMQAEARIIQLLLENEADGSVKLTHEEIASAVGVSRVTVSKTLASLAKKGLVVTNYGYIKIKNKGLLIDLLQQQQ